MPNEIERADGAGQVAPRRDAALDVARRPRHEVMGRDATPEEVERGLANIQLTDEEAERFGEKMAELLTNLGEVEDDLTDEQALLIAQRRRGEAPMLAAPEAGQPALLAGPEAAAGGPANLPEAIARMRGGALAVAEPRHQLPGPEQTNPRWLTLDALPGYLQGAIRGFGRHIFRCFPCYADQQALARRAGRDDLGEIRVLANIGGRGPSAGGEIDQVTRWISGNGVVVDAAQIEFPTLLRGYQPRLVLAAHGDLSYLLVEEFQEHGAPLDAKYIYAWKGGMNFYLRNQDAMQAIGGLARGAPALPPPAINPMPNALQAARGGAPRLQGARNALPAPMVTRPNADRRRQALAGLPQAQAAPLSNGLIQSLRKEGFMAFGTPEGPALRKVLDDGGAVLALPEEGRSLALSGELRLRLLDDAGLTLAEGRMGELADLEAFLEERRMPRP